MCNQSDAERYRVVQAEREHPRRAGMSRACSLFGQRAPSAMRALRLLAALH